MHCILPINIALCILLFSYGGKRADTLAHLRHAKCKEATCKNDLESESLPPTERAVYFHSLRVDLQVSQWKYLDLECLQPVDWGWKLENNTMDPIKTDLDSALESIFQRVRCKCKVIAKNPCSARSCSCRENRLSCVLACGSCHGKQCQNCAVPPKASNSIEEDERNIFELFESFM